MSDITISYKGSSIATMDATGSKTLLTEGKYCEDDITVDYVKPSGGDTNPVAADNDVVFIDYDGTIRYSYSASDFASLSSLPANPSHVGLTAQGWNWTLADAKTYVATYGQLVIGQNYVTSDGKTKLYMQIPQNSMWAEVRIKPSVSNGAVIDWGDESTTTTNSTNAKTYHHDYSSSGKYIIQISAGTNVTLEFVGENPWAALTGTTYINESSRNRSKLYKIEFGVGVTSFGSCVAKNQIALKSVTIPTSLTQINTNSLFANCLSLQAFVAPKDAVIGSGTDGGWFDACKTITYVSLPKDIISTDKVLRSNAFNNCTNLRKRYIPSNTTAVEGSCFYDCYIQDKLIIPASVTSIAASAFGGCYLSEIHMLSATPPTLANKNGISLIPTGVIYVPYSNDHSILTEYQSASNWSNFASYMQEESA